MGKADILVGRPFTFTAEEEGEITLLLRQAQRALWIRNDGYRVTVVQTLTRVNRILHEAINRAHVDVPDPRQMDLLDPAHVD